MAVGGRVRAVKNWVLKVRGGWAVGGGVRSWVLTVGDTWEWVLSGVGS